jgi:DNA-binding transcriptional LysR family regulator
LCIAGADVTLRGKNAREAHAVSIRSINLNLIPILQALLREESVAKAAVQVGLSQPAMSGALARLRLILDDPLLVRVGRSMRLTPRAQRMRRQLDQICGQVETLFQPERFDPATAQHTFVVAAPDYIVFLLSGPLLSRLREEAPSIRIRFVDVPVDLDRWIEDGKIDLGVCGRFDYWSDLRFEHLFWDRIVAAVSIEHPLRDRPRVTSADLLEFPGLNAAAGVLSETPEMRFTTGIPSLDWAAQISTSSFMDAALLAAASTAVARTPASLVEGLSKILPLAGVELSGEETQFATGMFWGAIQHEDQEQKWLRDMVRQCLPPPAG